MKTICGCLGFFFLLIGLQADPAQWQATELARFKAPEAEQGVAVDDQFFYAIANRAITQYRKSDGVALLHWSDTNGGSFIHLNAGTVLHGKLILAHSDFPKLPMRSSVETWDAATLRHSESHSFGETDGSLTWVIFHEGYWYACFAQYAGHGGIPGRGPAFARIVKFDSQWKQEQEWHFPPELVKRFKGYSASGGGFGPAGYLYVTGHSAPELYVLTLPEKSADAKWIATVSIPFGGQAFAWDPSQTNILYGISRKTRDVVETRITVGAPNQ